MERRMVDKYLVAIDIGTTKICVLVAEVGSQGEIEIIGIGKHPSFGMKKGVVVSISTTVESIKKAIAQAEKMAGIPIESAVVGISGGHVQSFNSTGVVAIKRREVSQNDVDRVIEAAKAVPLPEDREILHILPQYFRVDGQERVFDSLGMHGVRLEAQVHIITAAVSSAQNIIKSCELAGVKVTDIVLEQIASANAVLTPAERELGAGILDIGGGTSDFAIYKDGRIRHSKVLPIAGNHFTNDLAIGFSIPATQAEQLKKSYGFVSKDGNSFVEDKGLSVDLGYEGGVKKFVPSDVFNILEPRALEIFDILSDEIIQYRLNAFMPSGVVLTGGGALLVGMRELAEESFGIPIRIGCPIDRFDIGSNSRIPDSLKSPIYSTSYGLLVYALKERDSSFLISSSDTLFSRVFKCMRSWVYDFV